MGNWWKWEIGIVKQKEVNGKIYTNQKICKSKRETGNG